MNKELYWKRRDEGKRGQGEPVRSPIFAKGVVLPYKRRIDGVIVDAEYANAPGLNMVRTKKGIDYVSRDVHRKRMPSRDGSKPNPHYRKFKHAVPDMSLKRALADASKPDPSMTNHMRHVKRRANREGLVL